MITDHTLDQCLVELARTMAALKSLRAERKAQGELALTQGRRCWPQPSMLHAAARRASMDLTRKLADLRQGR